MLTEEQNDHLELLLGGLDGVKNKLTPNARDFVNQQQERHSEYGANVRLSHKQTAWLERLYKEHVGPLD